MKGKFIVLEGLDRCGKSSLAAYLQKCLDANKGDGADGATKLINFPNRKSAIGMLINDFLCNKTEINNQAIHLLFSANRWQAVKEIEALLQKGVHVICDRYWYSGVAYSYAKGLNFEWCMAADQGLIQPDLVVVLKGDPYKLATRQGYGNQRFEKVEFQEKVGKGFDLIVDKLKKDYMQVVNVDDKSLEQVKEEVGQLVQKYIKKASQNQ